MGMYAFRRMREQNEAAQKAASVSTSKPKLKKKSIHQMMKKEAKKVSLNGNHNSGDSR